MTLTLLPLALLTFSPLAACDDWPQWRGPAHDGLSRETEWRSKGISAWKKQVGLGYSTVSVVGDRMFTAGFDVEAEEDVIWCLDVDSGEEVWSFRYPAKIRNKFHGGGTLSTPVIDGKVLRSEEHTSELQSRRNLVCRLLLEKKKKRRNNK